MKAKSVSLRIIRPLFITRGELDGMRREIAYNDLERARGYDAPGVSVCLASQGE